MRWIQKKSEPPCLTEWRSRYASDINYHYKLINRDTREMIIRSLLEEQGSLCAYTGLRIDIHKCHIEHLKPQTHCTPEETVMYVNMVACYPGPNPKTKTPYGAEQKDDWPSPEEQHLFVSPLDQSCETRFLFNLRGEMRANREDLAAQTTIQKLALDGDKGGGKKLRIWRKAAIEGVIGRQNDLPYKEARRRLRSLKSQRDGQLEEFCFVLIQALEKHIQRLECIAKSKKMHK